MAFRSDQIHLEAGKLIVPNHPTIPFLEGEGCGPDIWRATRRVLDTAVSAAYGCQRSINWLAVFSGERAQEMGMGALPEETLKAFRGYLVGIKGPLGTAVGSGARSLNVALRQQLDLYACVRPVRYFPGAPSPVRRPEAVDMVIFRENTEDVYAGIEFELGSVENQRMMAYLKDHQTHFERRLSASGARSYPLRLGKWSSAGDPAPQRQHHEVHRRGVQKMGL